MNANDPIKTDAALMQQVASGDKSACRLLAAEHLDMAYRIAYRIIGNPAHAEDIAQEAFIRLWKAAAKWQARAQIRTWLHRVIHNLCIDRLRKENRFSDGEVPEISDPSPTHYDRHDQIKAQQIIGTALSRLPARQRIAITLVHFEELGNIEAADIMDVSVDALESLLARGRRKLKELLSPRRTELDGELK